MRSYSARMLLSQISKTSVCTADVCCICMKCLCMCTDCCRAAVLVPEQCERLTRACQQDSLRRHRRPVGGRAEGKAGGRDEEVQSERAGQQTHLPHSAPQDVSPKPEPLRPTAAPLSASKAESPAAAQGTSSSVGALRVPPAGGF